jgi:ATP-dependent protease ClpP protease subunit
MKEKFNKQLAKNPFFEDNKVPVSYSPSKCGRFTVDIYDYIESPSQFSDMIDALGMMESDDEMVVNLQSGGGCLSTTDTILHALRKTKGQVHFIATGFNASAATILLLDAPSFELSEDFTALIHCGSLGDAGNLNEMRQSAAFHISRMEKLLRNTYAGFMSEKEIEDMLNGKDLLLDAEQWCERHEQRNQWMQQEVEKFEKAATKALKKPSKPRSKKVKGNIPPPQYDPSEVAFKGLETGFDMPEEELMFLEKSVNTKK